MTRNDGNATSHAATGALEEVDHVHMEGVIGGCSSGSCQCQGSQNQNGLALMLPLLLQNGGLFGQKRR